ncbi:MAG TPA: pilus (MSHA type) biogenesis protein MshL [Pseudomonadales bacterium]|nr:pilus (MSHA type) biogenesis protein MshL [Pseudomonadales bacterium]
MKVTRKLIWLACVCAWLVSALSGCETQGGLIDKKEKSADKIQLNPSQSDNKVDDKNNREPEISGKKAISSPSLGFRKTFDVGAVNTPAKEFFMSLVHGQNQNIIVHPDVAGEISIQLKNVSLEQALAAVCDVYPYDFIHTSYGYKIVPKKLQSRIFKVSYLNVNREGTSHTRVNSGQVAQNNQNSSDASASGASNTSNPSTDSQSSSALTNSEIETISHADFWQTIESGIESILGKKEGTRVVVSPQAGLVLVEGYSSQLSLVEQFLRSAEHALLKQVIIEAKILEIELSDKFNAGVQWDTFEQGFGGKLELNDGRVGAGLAPSDVLKGADVSLGGVFSVGLNFTDFTSIIQVLKTQGDVQVLSSPRISTVNNQKAIIKVGNEEYFVTNISNQVTQNVSGNLNSTNVVINPFFSGIALDVTPHISDDDVVTLHIHPTVTTVTDKIKEVGLADKPLVLPLAFTTVRESDSIVKARSGQIIVLGGLIQNKVAKNKAVVPWLSDIPVLGFLFKQRQDATVKSEMVILLRPKVVDLDSKNLTQENDLLNERFPLDMQDSGQN